MSQDKYCVLYVTQYPSWLISLLLS